jgi:tetratricopeptide (TPR) repeat protein
MSAAVALMAASLLAPSAPPRQLFADGLQALEAGRLAEARDAFAAASKLAPTWDLAFLQLGIAEARLAEADPERRDVALQALTHARDLGPDNARVHYELGVAELAFGHPVEAAASLRRCVLLRPRWTDAWLHLGEALADAHDVDGAIAAYEQLARLAPATSPSTVATQVRLAALYEGINDVVRAEAALLAVVRARPDAYTYYQLARFYERHAAPKKAKEADARAAALDPRPQKKMRTLQPSQR